MQRIVYLCAYTYFHYTRTAYKLKKNIRLLLRSAISRNKKKENKFVKRTNIICANVAMKRIDGN